MGHNGKLFDLDQCIEIRNKLTKEPHISSGMFSLVLNEPKKRHLYGQYAINPYYDTGGDCPIIHKASSKPNVPITKRGRTIDDNEDNVLATIVQKILADPPPDVAKADTIVKKAKALKKVVVANFHVIQPEYRITLILRAMESAGTALVPATSNASSSALSTPHRSHWMHQQERVNQAQITTNNNLHNNTKQLQTRLVHQHHRVDVHEQQIGEHQQQHAEQQQFNSSFESELGQLRDKVGHVEVVLGSHQKIIDNLPSEMAKTAEKEVAKQLAQAVQDQRFQIVSSPGPGTSLALRFEAEKDFGTPTDVLSVAVFEAENVPPSRVTDTLSKQDKRAINRYTGGDHIELNQNLRSGGDISKSATGTNLKAALSTLPYYYDKTVYRATKIENTSGLVAGTKYQDLGFMSTSKRSPGGFGRFNGFFTDATVIFTIHSFTGRDITLYSRREEEEEVLFLPKTPFWITKVEQNSGRLMVFMTEMQPNTAGKSG